MTENQWTKGLEESNRPEVVIFAPGVRWLGIWARDGQIALSI